MMTHVRQTGKHFLLSGLAGVLIGLLLYILGTFGVTRPLVGDLARVLAPAMILGLAEPNSLGAVVILLAIVFVSNFALYGVLGVLVYLVWTGLHRPSRSA